MNEGVLFKEGSEYMDTPAPGIANAPGFPRGASEGIAPPLKLQLPLLQPGATLVPQCACPAAGLQVLQNAPRKKFRMG